MPTTQVSGLPVSGREYPLEKPVHREAAAVLPRSLVMKPAIKRKPLEKSRLSMTIKSKRAKKARRLPGDQTVFYSNIWSPPGTTRDTSAVKKTRQFVDISQVAHVLTTIDYKTGYEGPTGKDCVNIWSPFESQQGSRAMQVSQSQQNASNLSVAISEHDSEDEQSVMTSGNALSLGPLRMNGSELRRELSADDIASAVSVPVSGPQRKGDNVVFSTVLAQNDEVDMSWNSQFLLGLHEPVRHALFVIDRFLERSRDTASPMEWNVSEFFLWFKLHFIEFVKNQHDVKTTVLLPLIAIKFVDKREIMACYDAIYVLLDAVTAHEDVLVFTAASSTTSWQERLATLQADIRHLNFLLFNVLALEEEAFKPAIELAFSEHAFQRYVMPRIFRASKPKRVVMPWIVERCRVWGGDKAARAYRDDLPFTARFLYDHVWHPYFITHIASAMKHLDAEREGIATDETDGSWFGCSIM